LPEKSSSNVDIFGLLSVGKEEAKKKRRQELLASTGVKEFFSEGKMSIDKRTCWGVECKLCIEKCPTNALYWKAGEVGLVEDLCVYCGACVLCCMVDDCIKVERTREDGATERFSKPKEVVKLQDKINTKKRFQRVKEVFPSSEAYCERYKHEP
jgi:Na+-translocating ferredoxin:NAD+ oxidoreductase RNF subunit RnfB